jgi:hypothetical protein
MMEGKMKVHNETAALLVDAMYTAMANIMAITKACSTGKTVSPEEFYKSQSKAKHKTTEAVNHDGFAALKKVFVKE